MRHGPLLDIRLNGAQAHPHLLGPRDSPAENRRTTRLAKVLGLSRRGFVAGQRLFALNNPEIRGGNNAIGGKRTALRLAALRAMTIHDMPDRPANFEANGSAKTAACIHTKNLRFNSPTSASDTLPFRYHSGRGPRSGLNG